MNVGQTVQTFIEESRECLSVIEDVMLFLAAHPDDTDAIGAVFRAMHTILGSGNVALILDIPSLIQRATRYENRVSGAVLKVSLIA